MDHGSIRVVAVFLVVHGWNAVENTFIWSPVRRERVGTFAVDTVPPVSIIDLKHVSSNAISEY